MSPSDLKLNCAKFGSAAIFAAGAIALMPFAAQAAAISWTGTTDNNWATVTNWNTGAAPVATSAVTIGNITNNPVQISTAVSLNGTTGPSPSAPASAAPSR